MTTVFKSLVTAALLTAGTLTAQNTFTITGTAIPADLLKLNYGPSPKGIQGFDTIICNMTEVRHALTSSEIYQALMEANPDLRPIGKQIMLAAILRNQNHSVRTWLNLGLNSTTGVLSVLAQGRATASARTLSGVALGALIGQQLLAAWSPVLTPDQVEKFESQVLEPALVMDGGSCLERTIFTTTATPAKQPASQSIAGLRAIIR